MSTDDRTPDPDAPEEKPAPSQPRRRRLLVVGGTGLALLVAVGAMVLLASGGGGDETARPARTTATTTPATTQTSAETTTSTGAPTPTTAPAPAWSACAALDRDTAVNLAAGTDLQPLQPDGKSCGWAHRTESTGSRDTVVVLQSAERDLLVTYEGLPATSTPVPALPDGELHVYDLGITGTADMWVEWSAGGERIQLWYSGPDAAQRHDALIAAAAEVHGRL